MAQITLNPNSYLRNTQRIITLDADAVYVFNRSISAINNSVYGIQPTREQYISGVAIEDISANHSLCSDVYALNGDINALKFFAQRPFEIMSSFEEVRTTAKNPLAIYLTPIGTSGDLSNNHLEWIFVFPSNLSTWEDIKPYASGEYYLSSIAGGSWELIGSTSITDEEMSAIVEAIVGAKTEELSTELTTTISAISTDLSGKIGQIKDEIASKVFEYQGIITEISAIPDSSLLKNGDVYLILTEGTLPDGQAVGPGELILWDSNLNKWDIVGGDFTSLSNAITAEKDRAVSEEQQLNSAILNVSNDLTAETNRATTAEQAIRDSLSAYALSTTVADAYKLSVGNAEDQTDNYKYRFYQGNSEVGSIDVAKDQFVESASFNGTILILNLHNGNSISTDLKDVVDILTGDSGETTRVSVYINPETNVVSATLLDEYLLTSAAETLSNAITADLSTVSANVGTLMDTSATWNDVSAKADLTAVAKSYLPLTGGTLSGSLTIQTSNGNFKTSLDGEKIYYKAGNNEYRLQLQRKAGTIALCSDIPLSTSQLINDSGFLTAHQSLSAYALKSTVEDLSSTLVNELSNNVNPKLSAIADQISAEVQRTDAISADYVKKTDLYNAIVPTISAYDSYGTDTVNPTNISAIINWNIALHKALKNVAAL